MFDRRRFLKTGMLAGAAFATYGLLKPGTSWAFYQTPSTPLWRTAFRGVGAGGIPLAVPDGTASTGAAHYSLSMGEFTDQEHPSLGPTTFWGYDPAGSSGARHLGGIIVAQKDQPIQLTFTNNLPSRHIIPVDRTIDGANSADNRAVTHLHGGFVPWVSDGGPHAWFAPDGSKGMSYVDAGINTSLAPNQAEYYYPMQQSARLMWYHDHAWGTTRINAYAGLASALVLRDAFENNLKNQGLPEYIENGGKELPIIVQDKIFVGADVLVVDPTWSGPTAQGSLWYAHQYDTALYGKLGPAPLGSPPVVSVVPEFFGDTMLANGTVYPQVTVEARRYRLRILNACNARFLNLQMYVDDGSANGITLSSKGTPLNAPALNAAALNPAGKPTANFLVLGTEGGFLPTPAVVPSAVPFNGTVTGGSLLMGPAERVDVLFDFSAYAGKNVILYTDTPAPFPMGAPGNDYFPGLNNKNPVNGLTPPGSGPNTREIMRFKVVAAIGADAPLAMTKTTDLTAGNDTLLAPLGVTTLPPGIPVRQLTLNETFDGYGRLAQLLGTNVPVAGGYGRGFMDAATEVVNQGAIEVWQIANLTADTHPIHFHLVNVQILSRQAFNGYRNGVPNLSGAPVAPPAFERGWKETVRMNPGEITTVMMQFRLPTVPFAVPPSPRPGIAGNEYVWHCHILEHEEHDMMRPLVVV